MQLPNRFLIKTCQLLLIAATPFVGVPLWVESAVAQDAVLEDSAEADRLFQEGLELRQSEDYDAAIERFQAALTLYGERGDRSNQADTLNQLGNIYLSLGEHDQALALYQQAIEIRQASNASTESPLTSTDGEHPSPNPQVQSIVFQSPDISMPGARTPDDSKGGLLIEGLVALVPGSNYGETISPYPSFFVHLPRGYEGLEITFMLFEDNASLLYESTRTYPITAGILEIDTEWMDGLAPLEIGRQYGWHLIVGDEEISEALYGHIQRVEPSVNFQTDILLNKNTSHSYAINGLWFDALALLFDQVKNSHDTNAEVDLQTLLAQEQLDNVDTAHFIGSWHNFDLPVAEDGASNSGNSRSLTFPDVYSGSETGTGVR